MIPMLYLLGFALRLIGGLLLPTLAVFDDEFKFHQMGVAVSTHLWQGAAEPWTYELWGNITGLVYYVIAQEPFLIKVLNAGLGLWMAAIYTGVARRLTDDPRIVRWTRLMMLFAPPVMFLSFTTLKEQAVALTIALIVFGGIARSIRGTALAVMGFLVLFLLRNSVAFPLLAVFVMISVYGLVRHRLFDRQLRGAIFIILTLVIGFSANVLIASQAFQSSKLGYALIGEDRRGFQTLSRSDITFTQYLDQDRIVSPRNLVLPPIRSLLQPHPLRALTAGSQPHIWFEGLFLALFLYLAAPFAFAALQTGKTFDRYLMPFGIWFALHCIAAYTILSGAPETFRYRWSAMPLFFLLAVFGAATASSRRKWVFNIVWWGAAGVFTAIYLG